jgi:hypothetical protein
VALLQAAAPVVSSQSGWVTTWHWTHGVLETLYFLSSIGILIAAWKGLGQLKLAKDLATSTKELADANSRREAVRLAAIQCKYFAEEVVPAFTALTKKYLDEKLTFLAAKPQPPPPAQPVPPHYLLKDGDFVQATHDKDLVEKEWLKVANEVVAHLNKLESFAIPFAAGVATDEIGFQEVAPVFCSTVATMMPAIYHLRMTQGAMYFSTLKLYCLWNNRMAAKALAPVMKQFQEMIQSVEKAKINPI